MINLVGVYSIDQLQDVHLLEFEINANYKEINISEFTQKEEGTDRLNWQTPWDEKYLNTSGTEITGDWLNLPNDSSPKTRIAFFFLYLDFTKPLESPFGEVALKQPIPLPERLQEKIIYNDPN